MTTRKNCRHGPNIILNFVIFQISLASNDRVEETYKARRFSDGQLPVMPQRLSNLWLQSPPLTFPLHNAVTSPWPSPVAANLSPQLLHKSRTPPVAVAAPKSRLVAYMSNSAYGLPYL